MSPTTNSLTSRHNLIGYALAVVSAASLAGLCPGVQAAPRGGDPDRADWRQLQRGDQGRPQRRQAPLPAQPFRTYDGTGNNLANPSWGAVNTPYLREASGAHYADGVSAPAGADRPGAREISNALAAQGELTTEDERGLSTAI